MMSEAGMVEGVRIPDFTAVNSGPMATGMLADEGAAVIKVEPPEIGDMTRALGAARGGISAISAISVISAMFSTVDRNSQSIVLDLEQPAGIEALRERGVLR
jgi:crotonobetainyl-CoA:carnitine CoA-transferase CaiB-like acyl-CoA transferase